MLYFILKKRNLFLGGLVVGLPLMSLLGCRPNTNPAETEKKNIEAHSCSSDLPSRFGSTVSAIDTSLLSQTSASHVGMKWIPAGTFTMGAADNNGRADEYPTHRVKLSGFWMDETEVTNKQFAAFVKATGYITIAERKIDWEVLKKQLPPGTVKPPDESLMPSALTFKPSAQIFDLGNPVQWWRWTRGANWKHPKGPQSNIEEMDDYPVTQVCWDDAVAYANWAGKRLPTEAEWEYAAKGGDSKAIYPWGSEAILEGKPKANTWQGDFPVTNSAWDGFVGISPTKQYRANAFGLYDMAGNVWEWVNDWYNSDYYQSLGNTVLLNPKGAESAFDPSEPTVQKKITKGGSFMCIDTYCSGYRSSGRMKSSKDTALENTGFRCVSSD